MSWRPGVVAGFLLLAGALAAMIDQRQAGAVVGVAVLVVLLTAVLYADFERFSVSGGGVKGEAVRASRALELELGEAVRNATAEVEAPDEAPQQPDIVDKLKEQRAKRQAEAQRRAWLEKIIADAAQWGYLQSHLFKSPPEPHIVWNPNGEPEILFGKGERQEPIVQALWQSINATVKPQTVEAKAHIPDGTTERPS
ncbi:MAG: hypothetical protein QOG87_2102 [Actinomycetota bacterium]